MTRKRRFAIKTLALFILIILVIVGLQISDNVNSAVKELLPYWSRSVKLTDNQYNRQSLIEYSKNDYIVVIGPTKDGVGALKITKLDTELNRIEEYEIGLEEINFNQINTDEIYINSNEMYWRNNKDNSLYLSKFDDDYKQVISTNKIVDNIISFHIQADSEKLYLSVANLDGTVDLFIKNDNNFEKLDSPKDLKSIKKVKLLLYNDEIYLQSVEKIDNYESNIYITEFKNEEWSNSIFLSNISEFRVKIKDIDLGVDNSYIYSLVTTISDGQSDCISYLNGYEKETKNTFDTLKLEWASKYGVGFFSDPPLLISGDGEGLEILVVAPSSLTKRYSSSNVIRMILTPNSLEEPILVSNTQNTSTSVDYLEIDNNRYVFWNEYDELDKIGIMGASNKPSIIERTTVKTEKDMSYAIDREISALSYLVILCFGARLLVIFPALVWLLCLLFFNERLDSKQNLAFFIGVVIFLGVQLFTMDFYYSSNTMSLLPSLLSFTNAKYIVPIIINVAGIILAFIFNKETDKPEVYKTYSIYLLFSYFILNLVYAPYFL